MKTSQVNPLCSQEHTSQIAYSPLPFPMLSKSWYSNQQRLDQANHSRTKCRATAVTEVSDNQVIAVYKSEVHGTISDNIELLNQKCKTQQSERHLNHLRALSVANFIHKNGPIIPTQDIARVYCTEKHLKSVTSASLYETLSKHLNTAQVYIHGKAYLVAGYGESATQLLETVTSAVNDRQIIHEHVNSQISTSYSSILKYLDSPRDREMLRGIIGKLTSIRFASTLEGKASKFATRSAVNRISSRIDAYHVIQQTSQVVRTNQQQQALTQRIIVARKHKEIKVIVEGRGRSLKAKEFPELAAVLEYAFGERDVKERGGGGLESHPRLTDGTLYRCVENKTIMVEARQLLLSLAPAGFNITLSSCYNYTQTYRAGSRQAKRHHDHRPEVNANVSLQLPPRVGVPHFVVNLHWTTANVNSVVDDMDGNDDAVTISKDAKAVVPTDMAPVQHQGRTWSRRHVLPDHTYDQSRTNCITPMTFLFLENKISDRLTEIHAPLSETTFMRITRSGQAVTLLYLSFFEPETTFRCLNEMFLLLTMPELDFYFRNSTTGQLKSSFSLVVDNGPAEQPASALVQLVLVRLLRVLGAKRITCVSFAEYHSKRNFVERVHAEENRVLSANGPFSSRPVHQTHTPGSAEHKENMEAVAEQVKLCMKRATFGGKTLLCYRGLPSDKFIFDDQDRLKSFLDLSEHLKYGFPNPTYVPVHNQLWSDVTTIWNVPEDYEGDYIEDYKLLQNQYEVVTTWTDKYTTSLYSVDPSVNCRRYELQPLPDYIRWHRTHELHYLPYEQRRDLSDGVWNTIPGLLLPSKVLELCYKVLINPPADIAELIALLAWVPVSSAQEYCQILQRDSQTTLDNDQQKELWKNHQLYKLKKEDLQQKCRSERIPVTQNVPKHELVKLLSNKMGQKPPQPVILYSGNIADIPLATSAIKNLPITKLRAILHYHGFPIFGTKDELVIRTFLMRHNRVSAMFVREVKQIKDLIKIVQDIILTEREDNATRTNYIYRQRTHSNVQEHDNTLQLDVTLSELHLVFDPLVHYLDIVQTQWAQRQVSPCKSTPSCATLPSTEDQAQNMIQVGARVKVLWNKEELGDSGWKVGWYTAVVQSYNTDMDILTVTYVSEPGYVYDIDLHNYIAQNRIKLSRSA